MRTLVLALLVCTLTGCAAFKSNEEVITDGAETVTGPLCAKAAFQLTPVQRHAGCLNLSACAEAFCAPAPVVP